jgi:hypothetical protein
MSRGWRRFYRYPKTIKGNPNTNESPLLIASSGVLNVKGKLIQD